MNDLDQVNVDLPYELAMGDEAGRIEFYKSAKAILKSHLQVIEDHKNLWFRTLSVETERDQLKASLSAPESVTAEPAADYDALRKQFLSLRTLANSSARMVSHWRNQCGAETREALLANAANVSAERDTNQMLSDALLAAEDERDQLKADIDRLRTAEGDAMTYKAGMENVAQQRDQLKAENERLERNRDMWKAQVERQAEELTAMRKEGE